MNLLVVSTLSCVLDNVAPFVIKFVSSHVFAQRRHDVELRNELNKLKEEIAGLSMMNEFAKYARLQRRCNQLENILKENNGALWPIQDFLSWPCQHDNAISLLAWIVIARLGMSACRKLHM